MAVDLAEAADTLADGCGRLCRRHASSAFTALTLASVRHSVSSTRADALRIQCQAELVRRPRRAAASVVAAATAAAAAACCNRGRCPLVRWVYGTVVLAAFSHPSHSVFGFSPAFTNQHPHSFVHGCGAKLGISSLWAGTHWRRIGLIVHGTCF